MVLGTKSKVYYCMLGKCFNSHTRAAPYSPLPVIYTVLDIVRNLEKVYRKVCVSIAPFYIGNVSIEVFAISWSSEIGPLERQLNK